MTGLRRREYNDYTAYGMRLQVCGFRAKSTGKRENKGSGTDSGITALQRRQ